MRLLADLAEGGKAKTVSDLAGGAAVDMSVVSRHLSILRNAGIVEQVKRGKELFCVVRTGQLTKMLREVASAFESCCPDREKPVKTRRTRR